MGFKTLKLQAGIYNLANKQTILAVKPANATVGTALYGQVAASDTFLFQPERSFMVTLRAGF